MLQHSRKEADSYRALYYEFGDKNKNDDWIMDLENEEVNEEEVVIV